MLSGKVLKYHSKHDSKPVLNHVLNMGNYREVLNLVLVLKFNLEISDNPGIEVPTKFSSPGMWYQKMYTKFSI